MKTAWIVLDKDGKVYATHTWGGENAPETCPIAAPVGGQAIALDQAEAMILIALAKGGQDLRIVDGAVTVDGATIGTLVDGKVVLTQ